MPNDLWGAGSGRTAFDHCRRAPDMPGLEDAISYPEKVAIQLRLLVAGQ